jgi:hypothetical protein
MSQEEIDALLKKEGRRSCVILAAVMVVFLMFVAVWCDSQHITLRPIPFHLD